MLSPFNTISLTVISFLPSERTYSSVCNTKYSGNVILKSTSLSIWSRTVLLVTSTSTKAPFAEFSCPRVFNQISLIDSTSLGNSYVKPQSTYWLPVPIVSLRVTLAFSDLSVSMVWKNLSMFSFVTEVTTSDSRTGSSSFNSSTEISGVVNTIGSIGLASICTESISTLLKSISTECSCGSTFSFTGSMTSSTGDIESSTTIQYVPSTLFSNMSISSVSTNESSGMALRLPKGMEILLPSILTSVLISLFTIS